MLEWLGRDPLNGLALTIAFFVSLIAGRCLAEKRAQGRGIEPGIRLFVSFLLIIAVTLMKHWYFPIAISALCTVIALKLRVFRDYGKNLIFPLALASFILAIQGLTYGVNEINPGIIRFYPEGLERGFLIFARVFASASVLILLMLTTSQIELLESLRLFGVPGTVLQISSFMSRYIKTFSNEARALKLAQESRCGFSGGFKNEIKNIASIFGLLILRAFAKSDEVYKAMLSRAWKPELRYSHETVRLHRGDMILGILFSSGIIGLVLLDRFL